MPTVFRVRNVRIVIYPNDHRPKLDVDLHVPSLLRGVLGTQKWMTQIGKLGGSTTSAAKARAAAENGKLGGRPKKAVMA